MNMSHTTSLSKASSQLNAMIQQRHLTLWAEIVRIYEIEPSRNSQVRKWILQAKLSEKATLATYRPK